MTHPTYPSPPPALCVRETALNRSDRLAVPFESPFYRSPPLMTQGPAFRGAMTDDNLEERTNDFVHALAASDADVANISADQTEQSMRVTFDLLNHDNADLVRGVAEEYGFGQDGDTRHVQRLVAH